MNFELYVFKDGGRDCYPHDDYSVLFEEVIPDNDLGNQLIIRRKGKLIYYIYHSAVSGEGSEGVCLVFNGVLHTKTDYIFRLCNDAVNSLRVGNIYENSFSDSSNQHEVSQELKNAHDRVNRLLQSRLDNNFTQLTPSFSFGTGVVRLSITERSSTINEVINNHENVVVFNKAAPPSEVSTYSKKNSRKTGFGKMLIYGVVAMMLITVGLLYLLPEKDIVEATDTCPSVEGHELSKYKKIYGGQDGCRSKNRIRLSAINTCNNSMAYKITTEANDHEGTAVYYSESKTFVLDNMDSLRVSSINGQVSLIPVSSSKLLICKYYK